MAPNKKTDCIFCKIITGEIPTDKIYETKDVIAFLDINPYVRGHVLVVPKEHSRWLWDIKIEKYDKLMNEVYFIANKLRKAFDTEWVQEVVAGMGVEHSHIHLLPRKSDDGIGELPIRVLEPKPSKEETKEIFDKIKKSFSEK